MAEALRAAKVKTKKAVVELGLNTLIRLRKQSAIRQLKGIGWHGDLDAMRNK